jgi:hypothetical protein
MVEEPERERGK